MKKTLFFATIFNLLFFTSCNKENYETVGVPEPESNFQVPNTILKDYKPSLNLINSKSSHEIKAKKYIESVMRDLSAVIYKQINNKKLREKLFNDCNLKLDGDYEILVNEFFKRNNDMKDLFNNENAQIIQMMKNLDENFPGLQISIPVNLEKWDYKNKKILVGYSPLVDEFAPVECFYNTKIVYLDPTIEPDQPVIIVSMSERLNRKNIIEKNLRKLTPGIPQVSNGVSKALKLNWVGETAFAETGYEIYRSENYANYQFLTNTQANENFYEDSNLNSGILYSYIVRSKNTDGTTSDFSLPFGTRASERITFEKLQIGSFKFNSKSALRKYEPWSKGAPELKFKLFGGETTATVKLYSDNNKCFEPSSRDKAVDGFDINFDAIDWDSKYNVLTILWIEDDGDFWAGTEEGTINGKFEYKIKVDNIDVGTISSSPSIKYNFSDSDDFIDNDLGTNIYFWNAKGHSYNSGDVTFTIK